MFVTVLILATTKKVLDGCITLFVPDFEALKKRLANPPPALLASRFAYVLRNERGNEFLDITGPYGNRFLVPQAWPVGKQRPPQPMGISCVDINVVVGAAAPIATFYATVLGALVFTAAGRTEVVMGPFCRLAFSEVVSADTLLPYDSWHVAIYVADFSGTYQRCVDRKLQWNNVRFAGKTGRLLLGT